MSLDIDKADEELIESRGNLCAFVITGERRLL
jgi:hypothetical protein